MECFDHYPWDDAQRIGLLHSIVDALARISPPLPIPPAVPGSAPRFVKFGGDYICQLCQLDSRYCRGHALPSVSVAQDGQAAASLDRRIKECQGGT